MSTRRERLRAATIEDIKAAATKQIADEGPAALSLRAIARELGMTPPALYRYYGSRDDLVTALVIDAFNSFANELVTARDERPADDHAGRFAAVCRAYFRWAREHPQPYALIFGAPPPGYHLAEPAYPAAGRAFLALLDTLGAARAAGRLDGPAARGSLPEELQGQYAALQAAGMPYDTSVIHLAITAWSGMHGITALVLHGSLDSFLGGQVDCFVDSRIDGMARDFGLG
jgi:AcrR family transcriptional regulator